MTILNLSDLKEGMIVKKSVTAQGRVIIGAGAKLTDKVIHLFKTWGVTEAEVADETIADEGEEIVLSPDEIKAVTDNVEYYFQFTDKAEEIMSEIKRIVLKKELKKKNVQSKAGPDKA